MHESVVDPQPAPNSADLAAENRRRTALKLLGIAAVIAAAAVFSLCAGRYGLSSKDTTPAQLKAPTFLTPFSIPMPAQPHPMSSGMFACRASCLRSWREAV